jgi:hypothetical protein
MDSRKGNVAQQLLCRLNIWHRWRLHMAPESGGRYERCALCGKERDTPPSTAYMG